MKIPATIGFFPMTFATFGSKALALESYPPLPKIIEIRTGFVFRKEQKAQDSRHNSYDAARMELIVI